ncbi:hydroxymethylpyrimidine/phosphomethylpyrimidine kinase [Flavobacterium psychraquaticum]|uniref:hydroxymethylpyrimidine/phosphomethylpyrimidine kinase n=1 Tax=Flavobacterium psychraquaticum TaxID=3103958 RepID=UPI002ACE9011|nr:hydroxymethylpyrimidine/phosphomethylpyrimidine kinase [Flavobacterium sp. LB-N7T]
MSNNRPFTLTIAGFDPSGGAGVLADIKTFEKHLVYGFAIVTGNTIQTDNNFVKMEWISITFVTESIETVFKKYEIKAVKIGIIPSLEYLEKIVATIKKIAPNTKIIWDTVLKSSTGFNFLTVDNQTKLHAILTQIDLITPNYDEILRLGDPNQSAEYNAKSFSKFCAVLLKGGHNLMALGTDSLFIADQIITLVPTTEISASKHGSGCVLAASITANIALGFDIITACKTSKIYIEKFLTSNTTLLGYHYD